MSRPAVVGSLFACAVASAGCFGIDYTSGWEPSEPLPQASPQHAPVVGAISVPDFPPVGPTGTIAVQVSDSDGDLSQVRVTFRNQLVRPVAGGSDTVTVGGTELGEGFGALSVEVTDRLGWSSTRQATEVLVDLTPPKIVLGQTVVSSDGELELWVGDAWVLGKVSLLVGDHVATHEFEPGWPKTLGVTWDYSLVKFSMKDLPAQVWPAKIVATDAAGNSKTESFTLNVDGAPPLVTILSPSEGATLSGTATVSIESNDPGDGPVWVEVTLGGTPVGNLTGGKQALTLSTADQLPGPKQLVVRATDQAGNERVVERSVFVL